MHCIQYTLQGVRGGEPTMTKRNTSHVSEQEPEYGRIKELPTVTDPRVNRTREETNDRQEALEKMARAKLRSEERSQHLRWS